VRAYDIRELSDEDLAKELDNSHRELLNLRFRIATKQLTNTAEVRIVRKKIARLNTVIRERQLEEDRNG
jgi:large subunit ribosomal protein L29